MSEVNLTATQHQELISLIKEDQLIIGIKSQICKAYACSIPKIIMYESGEIKHTYPTNVQNFVYRMEKHISERQAMIVKSYKDKIHRAHQPPVQIKYIIPKLLKDLEKRVKK